jgi:4'-phosphopantetheinyl transferase
MEEHLSRFIVVRVVRLNGREDFPSDFLSPSDRERAARFRFGEDRARFILGRTLLAGCLSQQLGFPLKPPELALSPQGRPLLSEAPHVQFSISHTGDLVALALSDRAQVGIDLERTRDGLNFADLAERIFSPGELEIFRALPSTEQPPAFFQAWTGKEACLKATGQGIAQGMAEVSVPLRPPSSVQPIVNRHDGDQPQPWRIQALRLPDGYAGNVVWNDPELEIDCKFIDVSTLPIAP